MKKLLITIICFTLAFAPFAQANAPEKKFTVALTLPEWNAVLEVIEQSNASHQTVKGVQQLIVPQLQKQVDSTKK